MEAFLHQVLSGLATGGVYASLALALVMIYQSTNHINFAQGEMAMFSTYLAWAMINVGVPYWWAFALTLAISFCLFLAWVSAKVGLAPIVGAFAAGLVLDEVHYKPKDGRNERDLGDLLQPVSTVLVPIFFVLMGLKVDLRLFARVELLGLATALTVAAIVGKQICSLGVVERGVNRLAIGLGMIPRGEVGLIFAGIGATLMLPTASGVSAPVIGPATFGAVVIMVIITTIITPPAMKWSLGRTNKRDEQTDGKKGNG